MLRFVNLFMLAFLTGFVCAQEAGILFHHDSFEQEVLTYQPAQRDGVSDKDYKFGTMVLRETVRQTENDATAFNLADYFNVLSAFLTLRETEETLHLAFAKFLHAEGSCEYLLSFWNQVKSSPKFKPVLAEWESAKSACENREEPENHSFSLAGYAAENNLDLQLVLLMHRLNDRDQQYRMPVYEATRQIPLDRENERVIDSLYAAYGQYIGEKLVGEKFASVMWLIIQHSRIGTMERYLPVILQAVQENQLPEAPLRMLIDRIYTSKTGWQVFGSQQGVELLPQAERERIMQQYGME